MKQIIHIFLKDTRRLWPELLFLLVTLLAMVAIYPMQWRPISHSATDRELLRITLHFVMNNTLSSLSVLLAWGVLIVRVVQEEPLVGDRQYWLTRPYEWKRLLAAKALFLLVYLYPTLALAQCICLAEAGLPPLSGLNEIAYYLQLLTGVVVLPVAAVAVVTDRHARMTFMMVSLVVLGVLLSALTADFMTIGSIGIRVAQYASTAGALGSLSAVVIVLQYAMRRTLLARILLVGGVVSLASYAYLTRSPHVDQSFAAMQQRIVKDFRTGDYARAAQPPFQLVFHPTERLALYAQGAEDRAHRKDVWMKIPVQYTGFAENTGIHVARIDMALSTESGFRWSANLAEFEIFPSEFSRTMQTYIEFPMPFEIYDKVKSSPIRIEATLYYDRLQATGTVRATLADDAVDLPGGVRCGIGLSAAWRRCRVAGKQVPVINAMADFSKVPCPVTQPNLQQASGPWWSGFDQMQAAQTNLVPLREFVFTFMDGRNHAAEGRFLCANATTYYTSYRRVGRAQATFNFENLPPLEQAQH